MERRINPAEYGFNVACIEGVDHYALGDIAMVDGEALSLVEKN